MAGHLVAKAEQRERVTLKTQVGRERMQTEHAWKRLMCHDGTSRETTEEAVGWLRGTRASHQVVVC